MCDRSHYSSVSWAISIRILGEPAGVEKWARDALLYHASVVPLVEWFGYLATGYIEVLRQVCESVKQVQAALSQKVVIQKSNQWAVAQKSGNSSGQQELFRQLLSFNDQLKQLESNQITVVNFFQGLENQIDQRKTAPEAAFHSILEDLKYVKATWNSIQKRFKQSRFLQLVCMKLNRSFGN